MKHVYEVTLDDLAAFSEYTARDLPIPGLLVSTLSLIVIIFLLAKILGGTFNFLALLIALVVGAAFSWGYKKWGHGLYVRWYAKKILKDSKLAGQHSIEIGSEGINSIVNEVSGKVSWKTVKRVEQNAKYIFILLDISQGYVIPKESFSSAEQGAKFFEELSKLWESSKSN